jgi:alkylhydroperoxidase family enzyme
VGGRSPGTRLAFELARGLPSLCAARELLAPIYGWFTEGFDTARDMGLTEKRIDEGCFAYEDDSKGFSEAEKCALRYADLMFLDANQLDKTFYDEMKKHWSEAQIMELGAFIAFHYGMQMFMRSLDAVSLARHTRTGDPI